VCGVAGRWGAPQQAADLHAQVQRMAQALEHRGPDDSGTWADPDAGLALGHRRLSIIDPSSRGAQPMLSADERWVLSYNGEVYNHRALSRGLPDAIRSSLRGHSDTEVLLELIAASSLEAALPQLNGMFAFAAWDRRERELWLVRDRLGIKPLYYGWAGDDLVFASELKAIEAHPTFEPRVNRAALTLLLRHNRIPAPHSIFEGIYKLPPGHRIRIHGPAPEQAELRPWWSARDRALAAVQCGFSGSSEEAVRELHELLLDAVDQRRISDVPLGAFLSGGIDSSTVAALLQATSDRPVRTFSIGFAEDSHNEAEHAARVARHLGTEHTELYLQPHDALEVIPRLPQLWDEPFSDSSQLPTYLVSALARDHVKVVLSGDGGDELFAGYPRYQRALRIWRRVRGLPRGARRGMAAALEATPPALWDRAAALLAPITPRSLRTAALGDKVHKGAELLAAPSLTLLYRQLVSHWKRPTEIVLHADEPQTLLCDHLIEEELGEGVAALSLLDALTYLPDDILTKVDRASMAHGLEARVPLLDHRVFEFAWRLPTELKHRDGEPKWPLRKILQTYVPTHLWDRPKQGFGTPIGPWLRGPLRDWAESLLDERRLKDEGFFRPQPIREAWSQHLSGARQLHYLLWDVLMVQAWLDHRGLARD
jgi:asparagine synthase (glutamine-hydrolysing)